VIEDYNFWNGRVKKRKVIEKNGRWDENGNQTVTIKNGRGFFFFKFLQNIKFTIFIKFISR